MVEKTRQPSHVISLQAGPGEVDTTALFDMNLRINDRAAQAIGRQLAVIGDRLDRDWANRLPNRLPTPLHMLRPAQALTRTIYRDIQNQLWGFQSLSAAVKAWLVATTPGQGILRAEAWAAWIIQPVNCANWTTGVLVTLALVATASICTALWVEWKAKGP
ncbi:bcl-2-interacting killer [Polymixia lowei]